MPSIYFARSKRLRNLVAPRQTTLFYLRSGPRQLNSFPWRLTVFLPPWAVSLKVSLLPALETGSGEPFLSPTGWSRIYRSLPTHPIIGPAFRGTSGNNILSSWRGLGRPRVRGTPNSYGWPHGSPDPSPFRLLRFKRPGQLVVRFLSCPLTGLRPSISPLVGSPPCHGDGCIISHDILQFLH